MGGGGAGLIPTDGRRRGFALDRTFPQALERESEVLQKDYIYIYICPIPLGIFQLGFLICIANIKNQHDIWIETN